MDGNIDDLIGRLAGLSTVVRKRMERPLMVSGEVVRANIVKGIRGQKFNFAPLKPATVERKQLKNKSSLILISEGDYMASFAVEQKRWDEVQIGTNHKQGRALEFGYKPRRLQKRPHVAPALKASEKKIHELLEQGFKEVFK